MSRDPVSSRREALFVLARAGVAAFGASAVLSGCQTAAQRRVKARGGSFGDPIPADPTVVSRPWVQDPQITTAPAAPKTSDWSAPAGVIPRSRWTNAAPREWLADPMGSIRRITVHHDAIDGSPGPDSDSVVKRLNSIRQSHLGRGWADIGYHYVIDPEGRVWEGRPLRLQGAHVADQNQNNLGIVLMGNFERQAPTPQATEALDRFIAQSMRRYRIPMNEVRTHREMAPTACPGRNLQVAMDRTRTRGGRLASLAAGDFRG